MKESRNLEFKTKVTKGFLKTVSAFANFGKGTILFGVGDDGNSIGVENPAATCLDIENRINDVFDPRPSFSLKVNNDSTISLIVEQGFDKPYLYNGKAYRRSDTSTVEVDKLELRRLILEGKNIDFDKLPCNIKSLSFVRLEELLKKTLGIDSLTDDLLKTLGLLGKDGYNNAAAILADSGSFPGVDIAVFGEDEDTILDRAQVGNRSVLESFTTAMDFYNSRCCYEKINGTYRQKIETVPQKAFRETLANALVHRAWDVPAPVRISIKSNGVETLSPGGLVPGMSVDSYSNGRYSMLRNPTLAEVFLRLGIIEKFGTGVTRIKRSYEGTGKQPLFEVGDDFVCVTLPVITGAVPLNDDELLALSKMPTRQLLTRSAVDKKTGFEKTKTIRILNSLEAKGLIKITGKGRACRYMKA